MKTVGERLRGARTTLNQTQEQLGELFGVSKQAVSDYERDKTPPPNEVVRRLLTKYGVSPAWLLDGTGPMFQQSGGADGGIDGRIGDGAGLVIGELVRIASVNVTVSAGPGSEVEFEEVDGYTYLPAYLAREMFGAPADRVKRITISGNSMVPTVLPGQKAFVVLMEPGEQPANGSVYILRGPHGVLIKRLYFDTEAEGDEVRHFVRVHSDNPDAGTFRLPLTVFQLDYTVVAHLRRVEMAL